MISAPVAPAIGALGVLPALEAPNTIPTLGGPSAIPALEAPKSNIHARHLSPIFYPNIASALFVLHHWQKEEILASNVMSYCLVSQSFA